MTGKPLDYSKLSKAQQEAVVYAYKFGISEISAFTTSRKALERRGWLEKSVKPNTLPKYVLTPAGRAAYERAQQPAATDSNPLREVRVYREFSIRQGKAEYLAYRPGEEQWSLRAKTITELKELIDYLIESDAEAAQQPAADASAPVLCLNCGQPANRGDFALCWDCEYDLRSAASDEPPPAADASAPDDLDEQERQHYTSKHWRSIHNPQTGERQQVHAGATEIINALLHHGWQWDELPPAREADETTDELLHIIHKEYGIRADKLILEREELTAQLAASQEQNAELRATLEACKELLPELDLFYNWKVSQATGDNLSLWDAKRSKLDEVLKRIASEEASDGS